MRNYDSSDMPLRKAWSVFTSIHFQNKLSAFSFGILFVLVDHVVRTLQYYKLCPLMYWRSQIGKIKHIAIPHVWLNIMKVNMKYHMVAVVWSTTVKHEESRVNQMITKMRITWYTCVFVFSLCFFLKNWKWGNFKYFIAKFEVA